MARIRTIKPETYEDEKLALCSFPARWVFPAMWTYADDQGRAQLLPSRLQAYVFPHEDVAIMPLLDELESHGLIHYYEANGRRYFHVPNFGKHQKIDKPSQAKLPDPDCFCSRCLSEASQKSSEPYPSPREESAPGKGKGNRKEEVDPGAPSREGHDVASASPPEVREASPRAKAAASAMNNGSLQMKRQLEASRNAGVWRFDAVDLSLLRQAFEGIKGLPVAVNPADLPAEFGRRLARPKDDNDHAYDKLFALDAKEAAILCAESVAKGLACGNPRIEYVTGILRGALNAPATKGGESLANVLTFPAASAAAPAPKPYVTAPWYAPWVLHIGAKFRNDGDLFSERLEAQRREDRSINYDEAMGIYRAKGFEAAMDFLWERRRIQETG